MVKASTDAVSAARVNWLGIQSHSTNDNPLHVGPIAEDLESKLPLARDRLIAVAKKAGIKVVEKPDLAYGTHGSLDGDVEHWFQISVSD